MVSPDFAWTELQVPPPPDQPPEDTERALFEFAFNRILLVRYKSDTDIGRELNRDLFGTIAGRSRGSRSPSAIAASRFARTRNIRRTLPHEE